MAIKIIDVGLNNQVDLPQSLATNQTSSIILNGNDNHIKILPSRYQICINANFGSGSTITIGEDVSCNNLVVHLVDGGSVRIGDQVGFNGLVRLLLHEKADISIGSRSLIADQVDISVSDMHSIIDLNTLSRINPAKSIIIGERVWIGQRALIMKGAEIGAGSIIGSGSIVTGQIPSNCAAAGNPARVIREQVSWNFKLL